MRKIESQVGQDCIEFIPRTNEATYIKIIGSNSGCYSYVKNLIDSKNII